jgi:hypothetical protein
MTVLELDPALILRITGDPALYVQVPFLGPMQKPALSLAARFRNACTGCARAARGRAAVQLSGAFTSLVLAESAQTPNKIIELKATINKLLGTAHTDILIRYSKNGKAAEFRF